jgi:hypothetical protein
MTQTPLNAPIPSRPTVFTNANLVGHAGEGPFAVRVADGKVQRIGKEVETEGAEIVDLAGKWISPVSALVEQGGAPRGRLFGRARAFSAQFAQCLSHDAPTPPAATPPLGRRLAILANPRA